MPCSHYQGPSRVESSREFVGVRGRRPKGEPGLFFGYLISEVQQGRDVNFVIVGDVGFQEEEKAITGCCVRSQLAKVSQKQDASWRRTEQRWLGTVSMAMAKQLFFVLLRQKKGEVG